MATTRNETTAAGSSRSNVLRLSALLLGLGALAFTGTATAQPGDKPAVPKSRGALLYEIHCRSCHGETGHGDGGTAAFLTKQPPDLTALSALNAGKFPAERVTRVIDGRDDIPVHGRREMPVWGLTLQDASLDANNEEEVRSRIQSLVAFLRSIQEP